MRKILTLFIFCLFTITVLWASNTKFVPVRLSQDEINYLMKDLESKNKEYDESKKMLFCITQNKHYHSDLDSGVVVHQTRESLEYAVALLKTENETYKKRAVDIIKTILPMQEKDESLPFCGIWPYYPEDPLKGREAAVDYNWADFIAVPLIDVIINHSDYIGQRLVKEIKDALVLSAKAIKKRNVQPDYTNICIMGTYVCYVVGDICGLPEMTDYAHSRLVNFYNYTIKNKGFTEYNSPTYTLVAMDELLRMQQTIINPADRKIIDALYAMCWEMIATHFHQPSGQWCGPNLRSYSSLAVPEFYRLLYNASDGEINLPGDYPRIPNVMKPHHIPTNILPYFLKSTLPRLEIDTFVVANPDIQIERSFLEKRKDMKDNISTKDIIGRLYASPDFALASINQGYMWNQTRPLIAHWGTPMKPSYLQVRFLHDGYDFSAINIIAAQDSTTVLAIFNIAEDGGDTHPSLDRVQNGNFKAKDLRLRIEVGGDLENTSFTKPDQTNGDVYFVSRELRSIFRVPYAKWGNEDGYWEIGRDEQRIWADFVLYSGKEKNFNLSKLKETVLGLYLSMSAFHEPESYPVRVDKDRDYLDLSTDNLRVKALLRPAEELRVRNDYEIKYLDWLKPDKDVFNFSKK